MKYMDDVLRDTIALLEVNKTELKADRMILDKVVISISSIVDRLYSNDSPYKEKIKSLTQQISMFKIHKMDKIPVCDFTVESTMAEIKDMIDSIINEISFLGIPQISSLKTDKSISITNTIFQGQNQLMEVNMIHEVLKNELTGIQYKEIETIVQQENEPEKAFSKIVDKLKSFGEGVLASIVAKIITNSNIWSGLNN